MSTTDKLNALLQEMRGQAGLKEARRFKDTNDQWQTSEDLKAAIRDEMQAVRRGKLNVFTTHYSDVAMWRYRAHKVDATLRDNEVIISDGRKDVVVPLSKGPEAVAIAFTEAVQRRLRA